MRKLQAKDLLKCATILGKVGENLKLDENATNVQVGLLFFSNALKYAETDLSEFLADIAEMSPQEFGEQPFDYPLEIIDHLVETEDIKSFLQRVKAIQGRLSKKS
jgi:hypothetical protein